MTIKHIIPSLAAVSLLFTGCMTSEKWVDDDVYVLKTVEIPTGTDISDETDYNAFVYNRRNNDRRIDYYSTFYFTTRPIWMHPHYTMYGFYNRPFGYGGYYSYGGYYDPFGYGYIYDPYWGYINTYNSPYYYNPYGYTNFPYNPSYNSPWSKPISTGLHVSGPRGGISGYGGVRSNSPYTYKSSQAGTGAPTNKIPSPRTINENASVVTKPVNSYDRAGRSTGSPARTVNPQPSGRENVSGTSGTGRTVNTQPVTRPQERVVNPAPRVARPASTTSRTENGRVSTGSGRTVSPARTNNGTMNSGTPRTTPQRTISNGSETPRGNSGSSSGSSGSSRSGSSSSGSHVGGRRP